MSKERRKHSPSSGDDKCREDPGCALALWGRVEFANVAASVLGGSSQQFSCATPSYLTKGQPHSNGPGDRVMSKETPRYDYRGLTSALETMINVWL